VERSWPVPERVAASMQLEATLELLEAVEELRREVDTLRGEIEARRPPVSGAVVRVAAEAGVLVGIAVLSAAGGLRPLVTGALMVAAFGAMVVAEWVAARSAYVPPRLDLEQALLPDADTRIARDPEPART
jgi:hypothetical protein